MNSVAQAILKSAAGEAIPLRAVVARGKLTGLLFELAVEQTYHNASNEPIEAVFTFPLPLRAQLLGFDLEIGGRKLTAVAAARQEASARYEQAIDEGHSAALIEHDGHGLYTVSLGNLHPAESAIICYRYAELLDAHEGYVRIEVPTVIAPRYGNPADAGLTGPAIPGTNLLAEYPFSITLELPGLKDASTLTSPTHSIRVTPSATGLLATLLQRGYLDRDFVLEVASAALAEGCHLCRDGDGWVLLASPSLALDKSESRSLALKVLLDCSGSMEGASIVAAKKALLAILDRLNGDDRIALTRFGSEVEHVSHGLEPADRHTIPPLKARVRQLAADLGGTEMAQALKASLAIATPPGLQTDVLLITDGEIFGISQVLELAASSGQRLFTIAIGAAPVEALARELAEKTGGGCEFVAPGEDVEGAILRTFKRLRATPRTVVAVNWPQPPAWSIPLPRAVFPGDTLHLMAGFTTKPAAGVSLHIRDAKGAAQVVRQELASVEVQGDLIPRLAASRRLAELPEEQGRALALRYQLSSSYTSLFVVAARDQHERAPRLPTVVAVPQMVPGGAVVQAAAPKQRSVPQSPPRCVDEDIVEERASLRRPRTEPSVPLTAAAGTAMLRILSQRLQAGSPLPTRIAELEALGVPLPLTETLRLVCEETGESEEVVIGMFLEVLMKELGTDQELAELAARRAPLDRRYRPLRRTIQGHVKAMRS
jgi:Ca-activated chloride channel family protein